MPTVDPMIAKLTFDSLDEERLHRSTNQGGVWPLGGAKRENAISSSYRLSCRPSSIRGAWLVGPRNSPEKRYDSDGWLCQYVIRLRSRSGRRRNGLSAGDEPPSTK